MKYKLPSEAGIAAAPRPPKKRQAHPDKSRRKWLTKGEAKALGYSIP